MNDLLAKLDAALARPVDSQPNLKPFFYSNFTNLWMCYEGFNPTGTHKDRLAQAVLYLYRDTLKTKRDEKVPQASLISSGSAAIAIQACLQRAGLPNLKVLIDENAPLQLLKQLKHSGCEVYQLNVSSRALSSTDILEITENPQGIDLTSKMNSASFMNAYNCLNQALFKLHPDYIFVPFGSGLLYQSLCQFYSQIRQSKLCHIFGATTSNPQSRATKLYAPFRPFFEATINGTSAVCEIKEELLKEAEELIRKNGSEAEPSAAAGLALLIELRNTLPSDRKIIFVNTGKTIVRPAKL